MVPLWGKFTGQVENLTPNFSFPNYFRAALQHAFDGEAWGLLNFGSPGIWASKFGREKYFPKIFFLQGQIGGKFSGKTGRRNYTVLTSIGQGGIEILWLKFASRSSGNGGATAPQILDTSNAPEKYRGWSGKVFPLREYLAPRSVAGNPTPNPIPPKIFWGGWISKIWPPLSQKLVVRFSWHFPCRGGHRPLASLIITLPKKVFCLNCRHFCILKSCIVLEQSQKAADWDVGILSPKVYTLKNLTESNAFQWAQLSRQSP